MCHVSRIEGQHTGDLSRVLRERIVLLELHKAGAEQDMAGPGEAERRERTASRTGQRNGTIYLAVPRVREGRYFPSLLDPRKRAERATPAGGYPTRAGHRPLRGLNGGIS